MTFPALNHVAVTVRDIDVSRPWYQALIGTDPVLDEHTDAGFHHVVWAFQGGLDHVGFGVASRAELQMWASRLNENGIAHGGIVAAPYGFGLSFRDPDGIALELFAPPD